jgi:16S rRNA (guanine527-N7)-methyltransferase
MIKKFVFTMNPEQLLREGLTQIGFSYTEEQIKDFMTFLSELKKWNRTYNLTALRTDEDIIIKHFLDSLLYLKAILKESSQFSVVSYQLKLCDVGTGAGFPGIPIKIIKPDMDITLIEPSRKKSAFLRHVIRILKLNRVSVVDKRIETLGKDHERIYDVIVSRAAFKIKDFLKKACPYVKENGSLVLSKGPRISGEIEELKNLGIEPYRQGIIQEVLRSPLAIKFGTICFRVERNLLILKCESSFI